MTVLIVLAFFLAFALLDWALNRGKAPAMAPALAASNSSETRVDGFSVPQKLRFHPGHTWMHRERRQVARVGADEFAAKLAGKIEHIELPQPGQWIRQGQAAWSLRRNGETVRMASPVEGEVVEVNAEVLEHPELLRQDPYGRGWLMTVHVPDEESTFRNLVPSTLVPAWMRRAVEELYSLQPELAGATAADGGIPVDDLLGSLPGVEWSAAAKRFFLT